MFYRHPGTAGPGEELRRKWEVKVYVGDKDAKKPKTKKLTVIAWNDVDVCRMLQGQDVAAPPKVLHYVYRENDSAPWIRIDSQAGPADLAKPEIVRADVEPPKEDW